VTAFSSPGSDRSPAERLERIDASTLSDADKSLRVLPSAIRPVARGARMVGRALTAVADGDLMSVLAALEQGAAGDVLVVAADGADHAVAGELFASEAMRRGMTGIVIDGLCRDTATLARLPLPVYARGESPRAPRAAGVPVVQVPVRIGDVEVRPGDLLLGDDDGIVVVSDAELEAAIDAAEAIQSAEEAMRTAIGAGVSLFDQMNFAEHRAAVEAGRPSALAFTPRR
jgi:4-hydroxy-4-methyl-2-oxoglutarate aldolase